MPIVMGPPNFLTVSNIYDGTTSTVINLVFDTDQPCICRVDAYAGSVPLVGPSVGNAKDASAVTHHVIPVTPSPSVPGGIFAWNVTLDATDVSGLNFRPFNGVAQLGGARGAGQTAFGYNLSVPVRFFMYGDGSRPAGGGANKINWSSYTWAQWNPKGTTYPTP